MMLQRSEPDDFVIGTGVQHTVQQFIETSFERAGLDWRTFVKHDPRFMRPSEVDILCAAPDRARNVLGWEPRTTFGQLVERMTDHDIELAEREAKQ